MSLLEIAHINREANPNTLWEIIKGSIRDETIEYASKINRKKKEQEGNLRRDKRSRLGSTTRQTCTHAALTQSRMQHLRCKTGSERAPHGILLCCACLSAGPTVLAGQQAPSEPSWGPWQPRSFPLEPVPHRSKRGPGLV